MIHVSSHAEEFSPTSILPFAVVLFKTCDLDTSCFLLFLEMQLNFTIDDFVL